MSTAKIVATDSATGRRILALLDEPPPNGYARWTGPLLAEALGDVHEHRRTSALI
jgi:hypothetical protein